jgi:hypothetical protein
VQQGTARGYKTIANYYGFVFLFGCFTLVMVDGEFINVLHIHLLKWLAYHQKVIGIRHIESGQVGKIGHGQGLRPCSHAAK